MTTDIRSDARPKFAPLLDKARAEGKVFIKRKDLSIVTIRPVSQKDSPLDAEGLNPGLSAAEIIDISLRQGKVIAIPNCGVDAFEWDVLLSLQC